jgi:hypothetical protein
MYTHVSKCKNDKIKKQSPLDKKKKKTRHELEVEGTEERFSLQKFALTIQAGAALAIRTTHLWRRACTSRLSSDVHLLMDVGISYSATVAHICVLSLI